MSGVPASREVYGNLTGVKFECFCFLPIIGFFKIMKRFYSYWHQYKLQDFYLYFGIIGCFSMKF